MLFKKKEKTMLAAYPFLLHKIMYYFLALQSLMHYILGMK